MQSNTFNNLPRISKREAINILKKPISKTKLSSDYYKAVFHLANFPCLESEIILLDFIKYDYEQLEFRIARRKAIEVLAFFNCKKAIPTIADYLQNEDSYLVETAIWSLGKLKCNDIEIINQICFKLYEKFDNKRVVIQALTELGVTKEIEKIRLLSKDRKSSYAVKGASLAALVRLCGEKDKLIELKDFLRLSNQNDRHCAVQDIVNAGQLSIIPFLIKAPISPSFKIQAIDSLWFDKSLYSENVNLIDSIDSAIIDDPKKIETLKINNFKTEINFLIDQLFHTDFNRCYKSLKELQKYPPHQVYYNLNIHWERAKLDYGAIYFFINAYKFLLKNGFYNESLLEKVEFLLSDYWPDHMKFKSSAIEVLGRLNNSKFYDYSHRFADEKLTPFWKNRYTYLIVLEEIESNFGKDLASLFLKDSHRFVRLKAKKFC